MDDLMRMLQLKQQGFYCSQILVSMGLEDQGKQNPDLVRATRGLAGGLGFSGEICGGLTGGACLLSLYAGKGAPEEKDDVRLDFMVQALVSWFKDEFGAQYVGITCDDIIAGSSANMAARCPTIVVSTYEKVRALLDEYEVTGEDEP
jgi:C_GCAxxG_C_C family probable redox protein